MIAGCGAGFERAGSPGNEPEKPWQPTFVAHIAERPRERREWDKVWSRRTTTRKSVRHSEIGVDSLDLNPQRLAGPPRDVSVEWLHHAPLDNWPHLLAVCRFDLSTPLAVTRGYIGMALKDRARGFDERQQQFLEGAATASARCDAILGEVDDLLRVENAFAARLMPFERASVNLLALLEEAISSLPEAPNFVSVELRPSEGIVFVQLTLRGSGKHLARSSIESDAG